MTALCFNLQVHIFKGNNICLIYRLRLFAQPCCPLEVITATAQPGITSLYSAAHPGLTKGRRGTQGYENLLLPFLSKYFVCGQQTELEPDLKVMKTSAGFDSDAAVETFKNYSFWICCDRAAVDEWMYYVWMYMYNIYPYCNPLRPTCTVDIWKHSKISHICRHWELYL